MEDSAILRILDSFLWENRRLLSLARSYAPPFTINESYSLGEIEQHKLITASQIAQNLQVEKSTLSRVLKSLLGKGLIASKPSSSDRRLKFLVITRKGSEMSARNSEIRNLMVAEFAENLSAPERSRFTDYIRRMADGFGAPAAPIPHGPQLRAQMGRLTKVMGFLGDDFLGTQLPVAKHQILHLVATAPGPAEMSKLGEMLPYETSVLTRFVFSLQRLKLLEKSSASFDRRHRSLALSPGGRKLYSDFLEMASRKTAASLGGFSAEEIEDFLMLHGKLKGKKTAPKIPAAARHLRYRQLKTPQELRRARAYLVNELAQRGRIKSLPESLLSRRSVCCGAFQDGAIVGVVEIAHTYSGWRVLHLLLAASFQDSSSVLYLLRSALKIAFEEEGAPKIGFSPAVRRLAVIQDLLKRNRSRNTSWSVLPDDLVRLCNF